MLFKKRPSWISQALWLRFMRARDRRKILRRQAMRFLKNPKLAKLYSGYRKSIADADWPRVKESALALARLSVQTRDRRTMIEMIAALERVGCYEESANLWFEAMKGQQKVLAKEWRGEDLSGKTLLINFNQSDTHGLGVGYRCAHVVGELIARSRRTMILLEPRQAPTFQRTFPGLEIFTSAAGVPEAEVDFVALPDFLTVEFDFKRAHETHRFQPLLPDPTKTARLREKYQSKSDPRRPVIGISWYSSHHGKDIPSLADWRDFIARTDATFVSLQYGNIARDLDILGRDQVIVDESVDQLLDMDSFCSQVAAMDGVITIISTLTNVGAALAVPTVVLRDDWFRRNLPVLSGRIPWLPTLQAAGKDGRPWQSVLGTAFVALKELMLQNPRPQH